MVKSKKNNNKSASYKELMSKPEWAVVCRDGVIARTRADGREIAKGIFSRAGVLEPGSAIFKVNK